MPVAELAQVAEPARRRHDVAALALHRLDEDRRDVAGIELPAEQLLLDGGDAAPVAVVLVGAELAAVAVGEGNVMHVGEQRPEPGVLPRLAGGEASPRRCVRPWNAPRKAMIAVRRVA